MIINAVSLLIGVVCALQLETLPDSQWCWLLMLAPFMLFAHRSFRIVAGLIFGFLWTILLGHNALDAMLDSSLESKTLWVTGRVASLPEQSAGSIKFIFNVEKAELDQQSVLLPTHVLLTWARDTRHVLPGEQWQLSVRLKQPKGFANPGSFDYEAWLFQQGIRATGYVSNSVFNKRVADAGMHRLFDQLRFTLRAQMEDVLSTKHDKLRGILFALIIGDRQNITAEQWQVLMATGTNHLVAISGLHVSLITGAVFFLVKFFWPRVAGRFLLRLPTRKVAAVAALCAAFVYSGLAGFAVPTQRALVMAAVILSSLMINLRFSPSTILSIALIVVLLIDPFAALSAGFWLSFAAVAVIFYAMTGRLTISGFWWKWGRAQWVVGIALIPILLIFFQRFSVVSPLANLIAVPWFSFIIVPLTLIGGLFSFAPVIGGNVLLLAHYALEAIWWCLDRLANNDFAVWQQHLPLTWTLLPAVGGMVILLLPKGFPARWVGIFWLLPALLIKSPAPRDGELWMSVLDVRQGMSVVLRTKEHVFVYASAPIEGALDDVINRGLMPYLQSLGINAIDLLTVLLAKSDQNDQPGVLPQIHIKRVLTNAALFQAQGSQTDPCLPAKTWVWNDVQFTVAASNNEGNASCLVKVSASGGSILLTGQLDKRSEQQLLQQTKLMLDADILVVPQQGRNTASSLAFIEAVSPAWVLFSAGNNSRHQSPHREVVENFQLAATKVIKTAESGAIEVRIASNLAPEVSPYRLQHRRFWNR